jgi:hypothetical protein
MLQRYSRQISRAQLVATAVFATLCLSPAPSAGLGEPTAKEEAEASAPSSGASLAEALIREATELRRAGKDARAYPLFQKAYEVETTPRTGAQLGLVEMQLGYWLLAEKHLTESLASARDPWIAGNRADLEASLARVKAAIGELLVTGSPPGATVLVNGKSAGSLPAAVARVGEGPANIEARAPGHSPAFRSVIVVGGRREELALVLDRVSSAAGSVQPPGSGAATRTGSQLNARDREGISTGKSGLGALSRPLAWTSAGLAAAAAGFGVYQTAVWRKKLTEFDNHRAPAMTGASTTCGVDEKNHGPAGCDAIYSDFKHARNLAVAGYLAGGLLAAAAVTLFLLSPSDERAVVACAPAFAGGICRLAF